jgi:hypothetical protein
MIDDKHTLHSRGHPDGIRQAAQPLVSALICANLRKSVLFLKSHTDFLAQPYGSHAGSRTLCTAMDESLRSLRKYLYSFNPFN